MSQTTRSIARTTAIVALAVVCVTGVALAGVGVTFSVSGGSDSISTSDGDIVVSGDGSGTLEAVEGPWTNLTISSIGAGGLELDPDDKQQVDVTGGIVAINFSDVVINDNETDIIYKTKSGTGEIAVHGYIEGTNLSIKNASGVEVAESEVDSDGVVTWVVPDRNQSLRVQADQPSQIAPIGTDASTPDTGNWTNGSRNASLDTIGEYVSRIPGVALGGSGLGGVTSLVMGMVLTVGLVAAPGAIQAGPVAGAVVAAAAISAVVSIGFAPSWLWGIVLFAVGSVASAVVIRLWS
jgi:hypothetical protein